MSSNESTAVVIPTYNERENISALVGQIDELRCVDEMIIVDDASPDGTADIVRSLHPVTKLIVLERSGKLGLASAIIDGIQASQAARVAVMDADLSHDPKILPALISALAEADVAIGSRFVEGGGIIGWPLHRQFMSAFATWISKVFLGIRERDPMSGYFAIRRATFDRVVEELRPRGYKLLLEILVRAAPTRVKEVGYVFQDRQHGKSKISWTIAREYLTMILVVLFRRRAKKKV